MGNRRYVRSLAGKAGLMVVASFLAIFAVQAVALQPEVAEIAEPAADVGPLDPADVHMVAGFEDPDGGEHICSQWEIVTRPQGELAWASNTPYTSKAPYEHECMDEEEMVHIHLGDGTFMNSYEGRSALKSEHAYSLRVRFLAEDSEGNQKWSPWEERWFSTREAGPVGSESRSWKAREGFTVESFAEDLRLPTKIAMVPEPGEHPDDPLMYVAELYGTVKVITNDGTVSDYKTDLLNFNPTGDFPGSGEKGLGGLVVGPEGDLYVTRVYKEGDDFHPEVFRLKSDASGMVAVGEPETILDMKSATQGASHQVSEISLSPEGDYLLVHNGDGGNSFSNAPRENDSFLGKILRMDLEGNALPDNPFYDDSDGTEDPEDYIWAKGIRNAFGGGFRASDDTYWMVENGPAVDRLAKVVEGEDYKWPEKPELGHGAAYNWDPSHAPVSIRFIEADKYEGSGFPDGARGHAFVTESGSTWATGPQTYGKRIVEFALSGDGDLDSGPETLAEYVGNGKAPAVGLAAGPDGLYFTDLYKDTDYSSPVDRGANVLRVRYCGDDCPDEGEQADEQAPRFERTRVWRRAFAPGLGPRLRAIHRRNANEATSSRVANRGTAFIYQLSERSRVWIGIRPFVRGWKIGKRPGCHPVSRRAVQRLRKRGLAVRPCVMPQARGVRRAGRCLPGSWARGLGARVKRLRCVMRGPRGVIRGTGKPGRNLRIYAGRLGKRVLRPGAYLVVFRARDKANNVAKPRYGSFRVLSR